MDTADVLLEGLVEKAVADEGSGDLEIEGWVARYDEVDRQNEYFMQGAFAKALATVHAGTVPLLYQHRDGAQLGQVTHLEERPGGVWGRALIPKPTEAWAKDVYDRIKRKMVRGLSAKGMFTKQLLPAGGARIRDVDLFEVSVTPVAVGGHTATIETVTQKAFPEDDFGEHEDAIARLVNDYFDRRFGEIERILADGPPPVTP